MILGMPSSRGTGSSTMMPWSVPTHSKPWQMSRLVTRTCFCPEERGKKKGGVSKGLATAASPCKVDNPPPDTHTPVFYMGTHTRAPLGTEHHPCVKISVQGKC